MRPLKRPTTSRRRTTKLTEECKSRWRASQRSRLRNTAAAAVAVAETSCTRSGFDSQANKAAVVVADDADADDVDAEYSFERGPAPDTSTADAADVQCGPCCMAVDCLPHRGCDC